MTLYELLTVMNQDVSRLFPYVCGSIIPLRPALNTSNSDFRLFNPESS